MINEPLPFLSGDGEMARRMRSHRWVSTPLGPPERWPQSLRTAIQLILGSRYPMFVWWGPERINLYNDGYIPILGARHPEALGRPAQQIWSEIWSDVGPLADQVMKHGEATFNEDLMLNMERYGYLEETYFTFSYSPILGEGGEIAGMFCACTEETQRVIGLRRMALLQRLPEVASAAATAPDACRECARVLGAPEVEVPFALFYLWNDEQTEASLVASAGVEAGAPAAPRTLQSDAATAPWPALRPGERARVVEGLEGFRLPAHPWNEPTSSAMVLPFGRSGTPPTGVVVLGANPRRPLDESYRTFFETLVRSIGSAAAQAHALALQQRRLDALAELDQAKTTFFSNISHEFRTPLTLMLGPLEDLLEEHGDNQQLATVYGNAQRLLRMVNTLLDFARQAAEGQEPRFEAVAVDELTRGLVGHFEDTLQRAGLLLEVEIEPIDEIWIDPEMWEKIVLNLLSNAFKFTLEGHIRLQLTRHGEDLRLEVSDTGVGIPQDELPHLFQRFHRVRSAEARSFEGTGIGLALVKELAEVHGGKVSAHSELGVGSTFVVEIPYREREASKVALPEAGRSGRRARSSVHLPYLMEVEGWLYDGEKVEVNGAFQEGSDGESPSTALDAPLILWADDNADMRRYVTTLLRPHYRVMTARDGEQALRLAREQAPDLVLSDVMMPRLDGLQLLEALRADERLRTTPVVLLSARTGEQSRVAGFESLADDYLSKPFSKRELLTRIRTQLEVARLRRQAELELRQAAGRTSNFLAILGHELRNPISGLANAIEILRRDDAADGGHGRDDSQQLVASMTRQIAYLRRILDDLLDASRFQQGTIRLKKHQVLVANCVQDATAACRDALLGKQIELDIEMPTPELSADVDPVRLEQIVVNLLSNAIKYSPPGGRIRLTVEAIDEGEFQISIDDQGRGIHSEDLESIFELFSRAQSADQVEGLGVGLALVRDLVELHGGSVNAHSAGLGKGARFDVRLPGRIAEPPAENAAASLPRVVDDAAAAAILVVDDNVDAATTLAMLLQLEGHRAVAVHTGTEAIDSALADSFQLVLLDIDLPDLSGVEVARRLRRQGFAGTLVATTGFSADEVSRRSSEGEVVFDEHLVKPIDLDRLHTLIADLRA